MNLTVLLASILFAFSLCLVIFMLYMHSKRKSAPGIGLFILLFLANFLYMLGYALELTSQSVPLKLAFNHMQYLGIPFIVAFWVMISIRFCNQNFKWTPMKTALIMIVPVVTLVMNLMHTINGLHYSSYTTETWNNLMVVIFMKGPWYYAAMGWNVALLAATTAMFIRTFRRAEGIRRRQAFLLLLLNAFGLLLCTSSLFYKQTTAIDFTVLLLSGSAVVMFAVLFKYSLFDLVPLAYSHLFDGMDYPVLVLTNYMAVVKANPAAVSLFPKLANGQRYVSLYSLFESKADMVGRLVSSEESLVEAGEDPHKQFFSAKLTRLNFKENVFRMDYGYLLVLSDVTSHVNLARDLKIEASTDPLTGLLNRRSFFETAQGVLQHAAAAGEAVSLIMIDIDHYKNVNDAYGHQIGDRVLKDVSHLVGRQIREDDVAARYGGEEFVVLLPSSNADAAMGAARRMCDAVRQHDFPADGDRHIQLTISVGIATTQKAEKSETIDHLVYLADAALYEAKKKGRDRICCHTAE